MRILGTGSALPAHTLTNDDLSKFLDTSDEWIRTHTGIRSRQVITDETLLQLAARAANAALENSGLAAADIDYILASSVLPDTIHPLPRLPLAGGDRRELPGAGRKTQPARASSTPSTSPTRSPSPAKRSACWWSAPRA